MEHNDFRVVSSSSVYRKASTAGTGGMIKGAGVGQIANRYGFTLGEVTSANVTLDVNVGTGWTRIRLKEVPKFLVYAFNMITKYGMEVDGVFRKEGNSARMKRAEVQTIYKGDCDIPNDYTVLDVCTMVKRFLRDLKPSLLDSDEFRVRLLKKACQARISDRFVMTRDEMAELFFYSSGGVKQSLLSDIHLSTLGYVMRQLNRISFHSEKHRMTTENLAVVFVGSVLGDKMNYWHKKKQDMDVNMAAVKLLITNANLIGIRPDHYVTSSAMLRSSSAMPRCSSGYETGSSDPDCMSTKTASTATQDAEQPSSSSGYRRDSEAAHTIVTARRAEATNQKKKRSASFLPSFRGIRERLSNMKRAKSPSPDRLMTGHASEQTLSKYTDTTGSSDPYPEDLLIHRKKIARNESNTASTGSTTSGRQSRSQQSRRGNTNAASRSQVVNKNNNGKPTIAKLFDSDIIPSNGALRRLSASDQNADAIRFAKNRLSNEQMSVTEFLMSEHERDRHRAPVVASKIQKRNTTILGENSRSQSGAVQRNRRHTAPINNVRPRRNRPNTVGTGLPLRKDSSMEEKENQADCETDDTLDPAASGATDHAEWLLEQKAMEARSRRAGRKQKTNNNNNTPRNQSTESMMVLNGSIAVDTVPVETMDAVKEESPQKQNTPVVVMRKTVVEELRKPETTKQFCDMATSPMLIPDTPKKSTTHENGHAWVGTKQVVTVTPTSSSLARRQSRTRVSYSKATELSPLDMPMQKQQERRESSPLMSPILRHVAITNNSPPTTQVASSSRTSAVTPKTHALSPLVIKMESAESTPTPPPVPRHSPPHMTPQTSRGSMEPTRELKRITISGSSIQQSHPPPRRPPTPPSRPRMSNPLSPRLPVRAATIDNGYELPSTARDPPSAVEPSVPHLFKLPQLPNLRKPVGATTSVSQISPLARNPITSKSTLSVSNRANLRESKSIDESAPPLRSAPAHGPHLSPRSMDHFGFGEYTEAVRSAANEFALPHRRPSAEPRPSVAVLRTNNFGLVKSLVNQFQELDQHQRNESSMSGRFSAHSTTSLRSNETHPSSSDRFSDLSDLRHNLTSSESNRSLEVTSSPSTPTATAFPSRVSYDSSTHY
uniref:Rho-GAP domain-containing protein n=1 Tax=Caenorhabditis tropicalis TaxID=1561998 RepID=A0A1I7T4X6_9PELO